MPAGSWLRPGALLLHIGLFAGAVFGTARKRKSVGNSQPCTNGTTIPFSNRTSATPCEGELGTECFFHCADNYLKIGRHVCQSYETQGKVVLDSTFFGGRCVRLCETKYHMEHKGEWCPSGSTPVRWKYEDSRGQCLATSCWRPHEALRALALGNYEVWSMARNSDTGIYIGRVDLTKTKYQQNWHYSHLGVTGLGVMFECAAHALGWIDLGTAQTRVLQTLESLAGKTPGFQLDRNSHGWMPTHFDSNGGSKLSPDANYTAFDTGLNTAAVLFAATYFQRAAPDTQETQQIGKLAAKLYGMVDFVHLLCNKAHVLDETGTGIGGSFGFSEECASQIPPSSDGLYAYSEIVYTAWLAYMQGCYGSGAGTGNCSNDGLQRMWDALEGRRFSVHSTFEGQPILSTYPSYIVQLPFYTVHPVNADEQWKSLIESYHLADQAFYRSSAFYAGDNGRYGLAAGYADPGCTNSGSSYEVLHLNNGSSHGCRIYSPSAVAGYAAVAPVAVRKELHKLLERGDGVWKMQNSESFVLLRQSLLDPDWHSEVDVTMIDFASEMLGLLSLVIGSDFFVHNTRHDFDRVLSGGGYSSIHGHPKH